MRGNENKPGQPGLWDQPEHRKRAPDLPRRRRTSTPATRDAPSTPSMARPAIDPLWTVDDVAAFLGVPKATIYGWRTAGKGPRGFRVGKHLRWHPRTVFDWSLRLEDGQ